MNAPHPLHHQLAVNQVAPAAPDDDQINLTEYWDIIVDSRWMVAAITAVALAIGGAYAFLAKPVYESNLLIQVEDSPNSAKGLLGDTASLFDVKTPAAGEMEIIRSRMVIGEAVDKSLLYIDARPRYLPVIGDWLARRATGLSNPGILGFGGWVTGAEKVSVTQFDVPPFMEHMQFRLTALGEGKYALSHPDLPQPLHGVVGTPLAQTTPMGSIKLLVTKLEGKAGAEFTLMRTSRLAVIEELQQNLKMEEKGKQSGVIDARLQDTDRTKLITILNEIGQQYVKQNVERKAAEAQKAITFLNEQVPQFKKQMEQSEEAYSKYRNEKGTVAPLDDEAKLILGQSVDLQAKLMEAQQKRRELLVRFTPEHPTVRTLDAQIAGWNAEIDRLNSRIKGLPTMQQDALRLERDVKISNDLYVQLQNNMLQLELVREGKVGNVRLIDPATMPENPVKPKRALTLAMSLVIGLIAGLIAALTRAALFRGIRSSQEIEAHTGLSVYSTIPLSPPQLVMARKVAERTPGVHVLAQTDPNDIAVESLRSLRTALQFAMLEAKNNRVLITGATPGVGKSFVSANFAAVLASAGKRVLLIDADLRKGFLNHYFGVSRAGGLSELIAGSIQPQAAIRKNLVPNVDLITTGMLPPNPAELLMSGHFAKVLDSLSAEYDLVIIDTAPVLAAADTLSVAAHAGTLLLVARAEQSQLGELNECAKRLSHAGQTVTGVLFNAVDLSRRHYGSYSYKYGGYKYRDYRYGQ
jgi:tyrosine-protein kinase Etk/Wzc